MIHPSPNGMTITGSSSPSKTLQLKSMLLGTQPGASILAGIEAPLAEAKGGEDR
jgi:hypothetical protein